MITATSPYGVFEPSFNLVQLAEAAGASYVARWTTYHVKQLARSMEEVLHKKGFCFIEVLSPCPTLYQRRNKMGDGLDAMKFYKEVSKVRNGAPTSEVRAHASRARSSSASSSTATVPITWNCCTHADASNLGRPLRRSGDHHMQRGLSKLD